MLGLLEEEMDHIRGKGGERFIHSLKVIIGLELQSCLGQREGAERCHRRMPFLFHNQVFWVPTDPLDQTT